MSKADEVEQVPLFSELSRRQLGRLAQHCQERIVEPGMTVVRQGRAGGLGFFIIADGEAAVTIGGNEVATLRTGDHFGELALIGKRERNATVTATTPLRCLVMDWDFREFALENPDVTWKLLQYVVDMLLPART